MVGYALVHFRGSYLEADIDDMRSENRLFGIIGRDGALQLNVAGTKFPMRYMVDSQNVNFLSKMRNAILNRNQTTWGNSDARLTPRAFYEPTVSRKLLFARWGWGKRLMIPWIT